MKTAVAFFAVALICQAVWAQPSDAAGFQRASTTHRLAEFPKIHKDGRAWFQFKAPNAQKVQLRIGATNKIYDMERLADGTWNLVIPYPGPGIQLGPTETALLNRTKDVRDQLEKAGIHSAYYESPGTAHEFQTWRRCLHEFLPLRFHGETRTARKGA